RDQIATRAPDIKAGGCRVERAHRRAKCKTALSLQERKKVRATATTALFILSACSGRATDLPDGGRPEADAGSDAGADSGEPDSGAIDSGVPDSGALDSGAADSG